MRASKIAFGRTKTSVRAIFYFFVNLEVTMKVNSFLNLGFIERKLSNFLLRRVLCCRNRTCFYSAMVDVLTPFVCLLDFLFSCSSFKFISLHMMLALSNIVNLECRRCWDRVEKCQERALQGLIAWFCLIFALCSIYVCVVHLIDIQGSSSIHGTTKFRNLVKRRLSNVLDHAKTVI